MKQVVAGIWIVFLLFCVTSLALGMEKDEKYAIKAIKEGNVELLQLYLKTHSDPNCVFSNGKTGLFYAIVFDQFVISEFLLKNGADPNFLSGAHSTLIWAVKYRRSRILRLLIEYGADVNKSDGKRNTPLIYAAEFDNPEICKILIDRGANPLHENLKGKKASDFAFLSGLSPLYNYLLLMEKKKKMEVSVPSMQDGPYIFWENSSRLVLTYYERIQPQNLTRLIEKTIETGITDTVADGIGWDSNTYPLRHAYSANPWNIKTSGDIFVIGDIHGQYKALLHLLINNKIVDSDKNWIFGNGQLVLLGDIFDRGEMVTETLWFLYMLEIQARKAGGNVHVLLGNHEIMALIGDHRYLNYKYSYFTDYMQMYYFQLYEKNTVLGKWLRKQNVVARINDYLFLHAGISPRFKALGIAVSEVNTIVQNYLNSDYLIKSGSPEEAVLGSFGPQWYRGYMNPEGADNELTQGFVDNYLSTNGLKRMVLGHNEQVMINTSFDGKIISADVEIREDGKTAQGLLISGDNLFRCLSDGTRVPVE
ncbi:MAG: ankyrin repeat domain-containing protein [Lentimicrobiaceae bacterium]|nr:ankyrin repeat domain-containing protein [Lentimicrobiaceae bacterium]